MSAPAARTLAPRGPLLVAGLALGAACTPPSARSSDPPAVSSAPSVSAAPAVSSAPEPPPPVLSASAAVTPPAPDAPTGPTRYPVGRHSPLTASVVANLRAILARGHGRRDVFAKVGDSITISGHFLRCLDGADVRWGEHEALRATRELFARTPAAGASTSFGRAPESARVGWRAVRLTAGTRTPLARELDAIDPAWAVVMLGTNDNYPDSMPAFALELRRVLDALLERGVVPLLSTIPPRRDRDEAREITAELNAVIRAAAESRQIPLMDLFAALDPLPHGGLGRDGIHPDPFRDAQPHPCWFDASGLTAGMNQRNLLVLEALDRVRRKVIEGEPPDAEPGAPGAAGTWSEPVEVGPLPAVVTGDTRGGEERVTAYACERRELAGPERLHRVDLAQATRLRVRLLVEGEGAASLRWMTAADPQKCASRAQRKLDVTAGPGTYWIAVDTPSAARAGPYALTLLAR